MLVASFTDKELQEATATEQGIAVGRDVQGDVNYTYVAEQNILLSGQDYRALRDVYLGRILKTTNYIPLAGIDSHVAMNKLEAHLNLSAIYTALLTLDSETPEASEQGNSYLSALALLNQHQHLVLLGDPGSGKTTFVNFVAMCLAGEALEHNEINLNRLTTPLPNDKGDNEADRQPWQHGKLIPVLVTLRDFSAQNLLEIGQQGTANHLWDFIAANLNQGALAEFVDPLKQSLLHTGGILLLDGLDEVPHANQRRAQIKQSIEDFANTFTKCRILITSRTYAYQQQDWQLSGFAQTILAPFGEGQIRSLIKYWYAREMSDAQGRGSLIDPRYF